MKYTHERDFQKAKSVKLPSEEFGQVLVGLSGQKFIWDRDSHQSQAMYDKPEQKLGIYVIHQSGLKKKHY